MSGWTVEVDLPMFVTPDQEAALRRVLGANADLRHSEDPLELGIIIRVDGPIVDVALAEALRLGRLAAEQAGIIFQPIAVRATDTDIYENERKHPRKRDLVGTSEAAELLDVVRQRIGELDSVKVAEYPEPIAQLSCGKVWTRESVELFNQRWERRRTGRPRKVQPPQPDHVREQANSYPDPAPISRILGRKH